MKRVASEMKVPIIDLHRDSIAYLDKIGEKEGNTLAITKKNDDGETIFDKTHLDWKGSYIFGRIVAVDMGKVAPELAKYVKPEAATLPPEGVKAMKIIEGGPVKIVLVGDSTVNAEGGWGKGFCAIMTPNVTCINEALNGPQLQKLHRRRSLGQSPRRQRRLLSHSVRPQRHEGQRARARDRPRDYYAANIRRYIRDTRAIGAIPVVVTSLSRRNYKNGKLVEDLNTYSAAARRVGMEENVTVIDLNAMSSKPPRSNDSGASRSVDATGHADQRAENLKIPIDRTHLNERGQILFGRMVADTLIRTQVELGPDVIGEPTRPKTAGTQ